MKYMLLEEGNVPVTQSYIVVFVVSWAHCTNERKVLPLVLLH